MPHSQSYPVTIPEKLPEQPHLKGVEQERTQTITCSGWCFFAIAGVCALTILLCINFLGRGKLYPTYMHPYEGLIPIVKQGHLEVYPFSSGYNTGIKKYISFELPPKNLPETVKTLKDILNGYPASASHTYRHCWLQNPTFDNPCYFASSWITEFCSEDESFGYKESNGMFSPCFLIKIADTGDWNPFPEQIEELYPVVRSHYDPGFFPVTCQMYENGISVPDGTQIFPPKGFSLLYFPISSFNSSHYLSPLVAVRVNNIKKDSNVTVECSIIARNTFLLWDNGVVNINFRKST